MNKQAFIVLGMVSLLWVGNVQAVPSFARANEAACTTCHTAWPALNSVGRAYKENGYRFTRQPSDSFLGWDKNIPVSAILKARPYEKSKDGEKTLRALHEVELMVAGAMGDQLSGFFEIEAEDDHGAGFAVELPVAAIGYHPLEALNVQFSWAPLTWSDPYAGYTNSRKITRNRSSIIDQKFGGADNGGKLRQTRQNITAYGRPIDNLFYSVGVSGIKGDPKGQDGDVKSIRLAYDVLPNLMVGVMSASGKCVAAANKFITQCANDRDFSRTAFDLQADLDALRLIGVYYEAKDDSDAINPVESKNNAYYVEGQYVFKKGDKLTWVPLLRFDHYETNDGNDEVDEVTGQLGYYFSENARGFIEFWTKTGDVVDDDNKVTLQFDLGF